MLYGPSGISKLVSSQVFGTDGGSLSVANLTILGLLLVLMLWFVYQVVRDKIIPVWVRVMLTLSVSCMWVTVARILYRNV